MKNTRRHFTVQEKIAILNEGDKIGTAATLLKYNLCPSMLSRWKKDLNGSTPRQKAIKEKDQRTIEHLKSEIDRLHSLIESKDGPRQTSEPAAHQETPKQEKADELYHLVASLIVEKLLRDDEEANAEDIR